MNAYLKGSWVAKACFYEPGGSAGRCSSPCSTVVHSKVCRGWWWHSSAELIQVTIWPDAQKKQCQVQARYRDSGLIWWKRRGWADPEGNMMLEKKANLQAPDRERGGCWAQEKTGVSSRVIVGLKPERNSGSWTENWFLAPRLSQTLDDQGRKKVIRAGSAFWLKIFSARWLDVSIQVHGRRDKSGAQNTSRAR